MLGVGVGVLGVLALGMLGEGAGTLGFGVGPAAVGAMLPGPLGL